MDEIDNLRVKINQLDEKIMFLLEERYKVTNQIGSLKKQNNTNVKDTNREDFIFSKVSKYSHSPQIRAVYTTIINESKKAQRK